MDALPLIRQIWNNCALDIYIFIPTGNMLMGSYSLYTLHDLHINVNLYVSTFWESFSSIARVNIDKWLGGWGIERGLYRGEGGSVSHSGVAKVNPTGRGKCFPVEENPQNPDCKSEHVATFLLCFLQFSLGLSGNGEASLSWFLLHLHYLLAWIFINNQ